MADSKIHTRYSKNSSKFYLKKKIIIRIYIATVWLMIGLILLTTNEVVAYEDVRYFFWTGTVLVPLLYLLYVRGVPDQLSKETGKKQEQEQEKEIFVLAFSFTCLILAFIMAILI